MCSAPHAAQLARQLLALLRGARGEPLADLAPARVDAQLASGLGVDEPQVADGGQLLLARVAHLERDHVMAVQQAQQRLAPVARPAEVRHDHDQAARAGQAPGARHRVGEVGGAGAVGLVSRAQRQQQPQQSLPALQRRHDACLAGAERHHAEAVALARGEVADRERRALGHVRLAAVRGAEAHRRRDVEQQPRGERALRDLDAHVGVAGARGRGPVDLAHVVAELVGPHLRDLGADARARASDARRRRANRSAAAP